MTGWPILIRPRLEEPGTDQPLQTVGEHVAGDPEVVGELIEPPDTEKRIAEDEDRPGVIDQFHGVGHGAFQMAEGLSGHGDNYTG